MGMRISPIAIDRQLTGEAGFDGDRVGFVCGIPDLFCFSLMSLRIEKKKLSTEKSKIHSAAVPQRINSLPAPVLNRLYAAIADFPKPDKC